MKSELMTNTDMDPKVVAFLKGKIAHFTKQDEGRIGSNSVLVDLGLQSIDAVLLCGEVEDHFQIELDPATIFEHETLESFATEISKKLSAK